MTLLVTAAQVRDYLSIVSATTSEQYSDATIGSNILAAQSNLEQITGRYLVGRTFTTNAPWKLTTMLRAAVAIPGFRSFSSVTWGGSTLVTDVQDPANPSCWAIPDSQQTGVYVGLQFRAFRADSSGMPWWYADSNWWDKALDSPFYPGNYGGGYFYSSMPNDLLIAGEAGYDLTLAPGVVGAVPFAVLQAVKVLAGWYTMRPASILADSAITPQGGVLTYSSMPPEVQAFVASWKGGQTMMTSVGG